MKWYISLLAVMVLFSVLAGAAMSVSIADVSIQTGSFSLTVKVYDGSTGINGDITLYNSTGHLVAGPVTAQTKTFYNIKQGSYTLKVYNNKYNQYEEPIMLTANAVANVYMTKDTTAPTITSLTSTTHPNSDSWYNNNDPTFGWTATDGTGSGLDGFIFVIDSASGTIPDKTKDAEETTLSKSYTDKADGTWYFHIRAVDNAGNWGDTKHYKIQIDTKGPKIIKNDDDYGWYKSDPGAVVDVDFSNDGGGSLLDYAKYRVGSKSSHDIFTTDTASYTTNWAVVWADLEQGANTVNIELGDLAGSTATDSITFRKDTVAPTTTFSKSGTVGGNGWYTSAVDITLTTTDAHSGVDYTKYKLNGGSETTYTGKFTLNTEGTTGIKYWSVDKVGNVESEKSDSVMIDKTGPTVSVTGAPLDWTTSATATVTASDIMSGIDASSYRLKTYTSKPTACSKVYTDYPLSSPHTIDSHVWVCGAAKDNASNVGFSDPVEFKVDGVGLQWSFNNTNPLSPTVYAPGKTYQFNITWTSTGGSGVVDVKLIFDDRAYTPSIDGNVFYITLTDLPANTIGYTYYWTARNGAGASATSDTWSYVIERAVSTASIDITPSIFPLIYPNATTTVCTETNPEASGRLWRNDVDVTSTENATAITLPAGGMYSQYYVCNVTETQNYTAASNATNAWIMKGDIGTYLNLDILPAAAIDYGTQSNVTGWSTVPQGAADVIYQLWGALGGASGNPVSEIATLNAGVYNYVYNTSGGQNWTAASISGQLSVGQIANPVHLYLNGALDQDVTIDYGAQSNATGTAASGTAELWRDGSAVSNPEITALAAGTYAYKVNSTGDANYVANATGVTYYLTINKATPAVTFTVSSPITYGTPAGTSCTIATGDAGATLELWRNSTLAASSTGTVTDNTVLAASTYEYSCKYIESQNYTGIKTSPASLVVNKAVPAAMGSITPPGPVTYGTPTTFSCLISNTDIGATIRLWYHDNFGSPWIEVQNATPEVYPAGDWLHYCNSTETENFTSTYFYTSAFYNVTQATPTITLVLNGSDSNMTAERGAWVNATAALSIAGDITTVLDGTPLGTTSSPSEADINTGALALGDHNITAMFGGNANYSAASATHWLTVQDTTAPVITILSPTNSMYNAEGVDLNWTTSEPVDWAGYSIDGAANVTLTGNTTLTPGAGTHALFVFANDSAGRMGSANVTFTMECVSRIWNSTIDSTYYASHIGNLYLPDSTIYCSAVNDSEIINTTMTDSTILRSFVKGKVLVGMWIEDSWVDPTYGNSSGYSRISADSNVTDSSIWWSNITNASNVTDSGVNGTSVSNSNLLTTLSLNSTITGSGISYSTVNLSTVSNSEIPNATIQNSSVTNTQFCTGIQATDATITDNRMTSGYIIYNGTTYSTPTNITAMCSGSDAVPPAINAIWNTTAVWAGLPAGFSINATDNVAVANVIVNGTAATWAGGDVWTTTIAVPGTDGTYRWPVIATDHSGNSASRNITIKVNTSADPNATFDLGPPTVSSIWPATATLNVPTNLSANVSDDNAVTNCTLFINGAPAANMTDGLPSAATTVAAMWTFDSIGSYAVNAGCYDTFDNSANGTVTTITVSEPVIGGGGGGASPPTMPSGITVNVQSPIIIDTGTTGVFTAYVAVAGRTDKKDVQLTIDGLPYTWSVEPQAATIGAGAGQTYTVSVVVPADAEPGVSQITVTARSADGSRGNAEADLIVKKPGQLVEEVTNLTNTTGETVQPTGNQTAGPSGLTGALVAAATSPLTAVGIALVVIGILGWLWYKKPELFRRGKKEADGGVATKL